MFYASMSACPIRQAKLASRRLSALPPDAGSRKVGQAVIPNEASPCHSGSGTVWPSAIRDLARACDASSACPGRYGLTIPRAASISVHLRVVEAGLAQLNEVRGDHLLPSLVTDFRDLPFPVSEIRLTRKMLDPIGPRWCPSPNSLQT